MGYLIVIPARYASTRFPGKPLAKLAGKEIMLRVYEKAAQAALKFPVCEVVVASEDERILSFCDTKGIKCIITSENCLTGTDRVKETYLRLNSKAEFVVNFQGDNPFCPVSFIENLIKTYEDDNNAQIVTPCVNLTWNELDELRENKKSTPFSGTTAIIGQDDYALWFSKNIIPAIRKEEKLRIENSLSPVFRHIGLYGYRADILQKIETFDESYYEKLEGLEQLRFLENGIKIKITKVAYEQGEYNMTGIDTPEDLARAEEMLK
jgi:3-deoxy-manno-octulosonate cytidylyltransferase (CMP-KDO synthetase)